MQGIQDQKKRDILQIYITYNIILLILRSTKRNSAQKETKERKKVTERGREIEVDDIHKINRTTSTVCRLYININQGSSFIVLCIVLYCQNSSAFYETKYYIAI